MADELHWHAGGRVLGQREEPVALEVVVEEP